jgi:hypothetical protein
MYWIREMEMGVTLTECVMTLMVPQCGYNWRKMGSVSIIQYIS